MTQEPRKTVYDLENIIERCFEECVKSEYIQKQITAERDEIAVIVNRDEVVKHISKTIIGELHELEVIRRISPIFREFRRLEKDFQHFDDLQKLEGDLQTLRIHPEGM